MIETIIDDPRWRDEVRDVEALAAASFTAVREFEPAVDGDVALLLTTNAAMRALNATFRGKDKPTNVLSFPSGESEGFLGDIAVGREICEDEAKERGLELRDYVAHLVVHGLLHLVGYDHQTDRDADRMERREIEILTRLGAKSPYEGEAGADL